MIVCERFCRPGDTVNAKVTVMFSLDVVFLMGVEIEGGCISA